MIDNEPARRLIKTRVASYQFGEPTIQTLGNVFVREADGLVMIYDPSIPGFDTLYDMNASAGDQWQLVMLPEPACDPESYMLVTDTGTILIDDVPLRWLAVEINYYAGDTTPVEIVSDTIVGRIGTLDTYLLPMDLCMGELDWNEGGPLRCYSDSEISYHIDEEIPCELITSVDDRLSSSPSIRQTNRTIQFDLPNERTAQYQLMDSQGRLLSAGKITNGALIELSNLSSGIYLIRLTFMDGRVQSQKVLLE